MIDLWEPVNETLTEIINDNTEKPIVKSEAKGILDKLDRLETAFMLKFWGFLLSRINKVSKKLQSEAIDAMTVKQLYDTLVNLILDLRGKFNFYEEEVLKFSTNKEYEASMKRKHIRKKLFDEGDSEETEFSPQENFRVNVFYRTIDQLVTDLQSRCDKYCSYVEKFEFLTNLGKLSDKEITEKCQNLIDSYPQDLDDTLIDECKHFRSNCQVLLIEKVELNTISSVLKYIRRKDLSSIYPSQGADDEIQLFRIAH